jgi:hypothetical protein
LVPKPRKHLVTIYHGVLAPAAGLRSQVVPKRVEEEGEGEGCNHGTDGGLPDGGVVARGFCPSCGTARMVDTAAWLVDAVIPELPVRQWVLSLPYRVRTLCA